MEGLFHTIRVSNLRFRSPVRSILQRPVSSPQKLMGERKQMHFCMTDNDSIVCDEYKTHHFDGCWRYVDVGCGKKKRRVEEFRGPALWGISLSTGCIQPPDWGWPRVTPLILQSTRTLQQQYWQSQYRS